LFSEEINKNEVSFCLKQAKMICQWGQKNTVVYNKNVFTREAKLQGC